MTNVNKNLFKINALENEFKGFPLVFFLALVSLLIYSPANAGEINNIINRETIHRDQIIKETTGQFDDIKNISIQKANAYQEFINNVKVNAKTIQENQALKSNQPTIKQPPKIIVFISFSMPDSSLEQIIQEAEKLQVPVVLRGLYQNSFQKTAAKIFDLVKDEQKGGVMIDPLWFRKFNIESVPAIVVNEDDKFDVVYGQASIKGALKIVAQKGDTAKTAEKFLKEHSNE